MNTPSLSEEMPPFFKWIPLNQPMTTDEAIQKLAYYHNSNRDNVINAFSKLKQNLDYTKTIIFRNWINNWNSCIVIEWLDENWKEIWYSLINLSNWNPQAFCW